MIGLLVNETWLNLREGEEKRFFISKSLHDLRDLFGRTSDKTRSLILPKSPINIKTLGSHAPLRGSDYKALPCEVYMNGLPVLENASLIVNFEDKNHFECIIVGGSATFYNLLSDEPIKSLNFFEDNFEWNLGNYMTRVNSTSNVVTSWSQWFTNDSYQKYIDGGGDPTGEKMESTDIDKAGFSYYTKDILSKIFENTGLEVILDDIPDLYNSLAIVCPMTHIFDSKDSVNTDICIIHKLNFQLIDLNIFLKVEFDNVILNSGVWSTSNFWATPSNKSEFEIKSTISKSRDLVEAPVICQLVVESSTGFITVLQEETATFISPAVFNQIVVLDVNHHIYMRVKGSGVSQNIIPISTFDFNSRAGAERSINIIDWLPDISQKELVKNIFNLFHIVVSNVSGRIVLSLFDKIPTNPEINLEDKAAIDRQVKYSNKIPSHAQENIFLYAPEPLVVSTVFNGSIDIKNNTIPEFVTRIELFFAGMDISLFDFPGSVVPLYSIEYRKEDNNKMTITGSAPNNATYDTPDANPLKENDTIFMEVGGTIERFVVKSIVDNRKGVLQWTLNINESEQDWSFVHYEKNTHKFQLANLILDNTRLYPHFENSEIALAPAIFYTEVLSWDFLIETFYPNYKAMIQDAQMVQIWVDISNLAFLEMNSTRPIFILGNSYYLNNTEQYKEAGLTRLELIRLN